MNADTIVKALGGQRGMACFPCHEDKNASLSVSNKNGKVLVHCHAGCAQEDVVAALKERGLWPSPNDDYALRDARPPRAPDNNDPLHSFCKAMDMLRLCNGGDYLDRQQGKGYEEQPETYLRQCRKIALMPSNARVLSASDAHRATGFRYPAMVLPIVNERHRLLGAHLTFLTADASENAAGHNGNIRRMFGPVKGGFVRLGPINPDRPLIVGEGVETVLSAMQITGLSGIAALSAKNLGNDVIPPPCSAILIAADNDKAGREAANALSERLNSPARPVSIIYPPERGDWNDELRESDDLGALKELFERARLEEPSADNSKSDVIGMTTFLTLKFPKRLCLLKPWLKTGDLAMLIADGGVGKTPSCTIDWLRGRIREVLNGLDLRASREGLVCGRRNAWRATATMAERARSCPAR